MRRLSTESSNAHIYNRRSNEFAPGHQRIQSTKYSTILTELDFIIFKTYVLVCRRYPSAKFSTDEQRTRLGL